MKNFKITNFGSEIPEPYSEWFLRNATEIAKKDAPKYDPCRLFKAGDIVEPCQVKGRWLAETWKDRAGIHFTVMEDEDEAGLITLKDPDSVILRYEVDAVYFQLVTPVEELDPYSVRENEYSKCVEVRRSHPVRVCATYYWGGEYPAYTKEQALARAEAERDRLNVERRKEVEK